MDGRVVVLASLVSLGVLALLGITAGAVDETEVYTTIDADFHHLGDHFVPTYQPQTPEGTEYSKTFEAPAEVESPAIKMWIRGQVPANQISIDYVKLYVNDELLAYLNEYAMGSGTIYEVDDEVEIEVSIEEGILVAGTNELKIVTGWGHSSSDRDDIMFWNIRLVRARPLEVSCNLISPVPGDVHYTMMDQETLSLIVWNDRHVDALQWVRVTLDPGGADVSFRWVQNTNAFHLDDDSSTYASFPAGWHRSSKDILNRTWYLEVDMAFLWSFPTDGPVDVRVLVRDDQTREHRFVFEDVLEVMTGLDLSGPVRLSGERQGPLGPGSWVAGGEALSVVVPPVIYRGSPDVHPPEGTASVSLVWGSVEVGRSTAPEGEDWHAEWSVPWSARATVSATISLVDLPKGARAPEPVSIPLEVDGRAPGWLDMAPADGSWLTSATVEAWADVTDADGSGLDLMSMQFQVLDPSTGAWGPWGPAWVIPQGGQGGITRAVRTLELEQASGHMVRWRAWDSVGNGPSESRPVAFGVDHMAVELEPMTPEGWLATKEVDVGCLVGDPDAGLGSSGVDLDSIEISVLPHGASEWSGWELPDSDVTVRDGGATVEAWTRVTLAEGGDNLVRWRARDVAGNPLILSPPQTIAVDLTPPFLASHWPFAATLDRSDGASAVAVMDDGGGSGVDAGTLEYSIVVGIGGDVEPTVWNHAQIEMLEDGMVRGKADLSGLSGHANWVWWRVLDNAGNGPSQHGPFRVRFNMPPTAVISSPQQGSKHQLPGTVLLSAEGSHDPDPGDGLETHWWSDLDGYLGTGSELPVSLRAGEHTITLRVDDGLGDDHVASASVRITVVQRVEVDEASSPWWVLVIVLLLVGAVVLIRTWAVRRRLDPWEEVR